MTMDDSFDNKPILWLQSGSKVKSQNGSFQQCVCVCVLDRGRHIHGNMTLEGLSKASCVNVSMWVISFFCICFYYYFFFETNLWSWNMKPTQGLFEKLVNPHRPSDKKPNIYITSEINSFIPHLNCIKTSNYPWLKEWLFWWGRLT